MNPCDGAGRIPCTCGAAEYTAARGYFRAPPPCTCERECPGCEACRPEGDAAKHAELSTWYHAKIGTAPPRAKAGRAGEAKAADPQGRLKLEG